MKKILIVEDDAAIREELQELLQNSGYMTEAIQDFVDTVASIHKMQADLVIMDINLPGMNGELLLRELREISQTPVIMVTSRTQEADEVLSMSYGADDYITKPYNPTILLLRIAAILKRADQPGAQLSWRDTLLNAARGSLCRGEEELVLTKNEMIIFRLLLENQNRIVSRDALMTDLWNNDEFINDNALTVNISRLRAKLAAFGYPDAIETRKKQGYILL